MGSESIFIDEVLVGDAGAEKLTLTPFITELSDDHRVLVPPEPIPNSVVKRYIADGSVGLPHVRVGHRQALFRTCLDTKQVTIKF